MAGRKDKNIVDYFPHYCVSGKTLFIIESKFGYLGYAIWFKTLEILGSSENHYIDLRDDSDMLYLISKLKITEQQFTDIYNLLSKLAAIDSDLWDNKIIYSENFIENINDAYKRRSNKCMHKLDLCIHLNIKCKQELKKSTHKSTKERKVKESKEEESKENNIPTYSDFENHALSKIFNLSNESIKLKYDSWVENDWKDGNGKKIVNWKSKLTNTVQYLKIDESKHSQEKLYTYKVHFTVYSNKTEKQYKEALKQYGDNLILQ